MVVVEERGTPAGLHQALGETRRERGRDAPWESSSRVLGSPKTSTIYRGKGRRPRVSPRGRRPSRLDLARENPRETCPPSQAGGGLPPKPGGGAPPPQVTWERVWGAHHPLVGWFAPSPLAHEALQHLPGLPKHLSVMLAIAWYPRNTSGLQYPSSNISIFTARPFRNSS